MNKLEERAIESVTNVVGLLFVDKLKMSSAVKASIEIYKLFAEACRFARAHDKIDDVQLEKLESYLAGLAELEALE